MAAPEGQNKFAGVRFLPKDLELLAILDAKLRGSPLGPVEAIFHDTQILDFHPYKLYGIHRLDRSISLSLSLSLSISFFFSGDGWVPGSDHAVLGILIRDFGWILLD